VAVPPLPQACGGSGAASRDPRATGACRCLALWARGCTACRSRASGSKNKKRTGGLRAALRPVGASPRWVNPLRPRDPSNTPAGRLMPTFWWLVRSSSRRTLILISPFARAGAAVRPPVHASHVT